MRRLREALTFALSLLFLPVFTALMLQGVAASVLAGAAISVLTLFLGPPQLALHCLRYLWTGKPGDPQGLTNIPLGMTGWALGGAAGTFVVAALALLDPAPGHVQAVSLALAAAIQAAAMLWLLAVFGPPEGAMSGHPLLHKAYLWVLAFSLTSMFLSIGVTGPALVIAAAWHAPEFPRLTGCYLLCASTPALFAGAGLLRRGLWMLDVRAATANLGTSTARAAAAGLVELRGKAVGDDGEGGGEIRLDAPFRLDDGTGVVRVVPPPSTAGADERLWLEDATGRRRAGASVPRGRELLVVGEFAPPDTLRPWNPPFGRVLQGVVDRLVDETLQKDADMSWNKLGFGAPGEVFLVTDLDEAGAKARLMAAWRRTLLLAVLLLGSAAVLLALGARRLGLF